MRYLGIYKHPMDRRGPDRQKRLQAGQQGWYAFKRLWNNTSVPHKTKKLVYKGCVTSAIYSGQTAVHLEEGDSDTYDRYLMRCARKLEGIQGYTALQWRTGRWKARSIDARTILLLQGLNMRRRNGSGYVR